METEKYLDDEAAARGFVADRRRRRGWGRVRLVAELRRRGADAAAIDAAVGEVDDEDEERLVAAEVAAWRRSGGGHPDRLARRLNRKGLPARAILDALKEELGRRD